MPNPFEPQAPMNPQDPALPLDYATNPPFSNSGVQVGALVFMVVIGLLIYVSHGEKSSRKLSWE